MSLISTNSFQYKVLQTRSDSRETELRVWCRHWTFTGNWRFCVLCFTWFSQARGNMFFEVPKSERQKSRSLKVPVIPPFFFCIPCPYSSFQPTRELTTNLPLTFPQTPAWFYSWLEFSWRVQRVIDRVQTRQKSRIFLVSFGHPNIVIVKWN
jgi:hypothetical protein